MKWAEKQIADGEKVASRPLTVSTLPDVAKHFARDSWEDVMMDEEAKKTFEDVAYHPTDAPSTLDLVLLLRRPW